MPYDTNFTSAPSKSRGCFFIHMEHSPTISGTHVLQSADTHVAKIGGNNAARIAFNVENAKQKLASGIAQILTLSAIRSSDDEFSEFADGTVADTDANGTRKPGFNTTSHLIAVAKLMENGAPEARERAAGIAKRIGAFTRNVAMQQIRGDSSIADPAALEAEIDAIIARIIDGEEGSLLSGIQALEGSANIIHDGEDWLHKTDDSYTSVTGMGEQLAREIYAAYFKAAGVDCGSLELSESAQTMYESIFGEQQQPSDHVRQLRSITSARMETLLKNHNVVISGGYMPALGSRRGYSDQAGAVIASAAKDTGRDTVFVVEKDFPIMSADPNRLDDARVIREMTYFLAEELFGNTRGANGQAIHPDALDILSKAGLQTVVLNPEQQQDERMTVIHHFDPVANGVEIIASKSIPFSLQITASQMIGEAGFEARVAQWFTDNNISIQHIATSESTLSYTFYNGEYDDTLLENLRAFLEQEFDLHAPDTVEVHSDVSVIYCLGNNMRSPGQAAKATDALHMANIDIKLITQGLNECVMTFLVDRDDAEQAVHSLHDLLISLPKDTYDSLRTAFHQQLLAAVEQTKRL